MKNLRFRLKYFGILCGALLLVCFFLHGCSSDNTEELSGGYFYRDEGVNAKDILCHLPNRKGIYSKITGYDYNADFIVAVQQPNYEEYKTMIGFDLRDNLKKYPKNSSEERIESEKEADSILKHDPYYKLIFAHKTNYWIIVNKSKEVLGPLTQMEYQSKRKYLNIPESIEVK
jgi:hypothetical protein